MKSGRAAPVRAHAASTERTRSASARRTVSAAAAASRRFSGSRSGARPKSIGAPTLTRTSGRRSPRTRAPSEKLRRSAGGDRDDDRTAAQRQVADPGLHRADIAPAPRALGEDADDTAGPQDLDRAAHRARIDRISTNRDLARLPQHRAHDRHERLSLDQAGDAALGEPTQQRPVPERAVVHREQDRAVGRYRLQTRHLHPGDRVDDAGSERLQAAQRDAAGDEVSDGRIEPRSQPSPRSSCRQVAEPPRQ